MWVIKILQLVVETKRLYVTLIIMAFVKLKDVVGTSSKGVPYYISWKSVQLFKPWEGHTRTTRKSQMKTLKVR